mmetsp:Transcript_26593/g.76809  ORF Transcript_26593/g.76809 Transcript_26593/m.76809 type:complete len:314 (-) Transcript_26593:228-1169(-)
MSPLLHLHLDRSSHEGVGTREQLVVFARLVDKGPRVGRPRRARKQLEHGPGHDVDVLRHEEGGPVAGILGGQAPRLLEGFHPRSDEGQGPQGRGGQPAQRQVERMLALEVAALVADDGHDLLVGAPVQQGRRHHDDGRGGRLRFGPTTLGIVAQGQGEGIGLRVGLHVQLRDGVQVQYPRAFPHGLVQLGKLRLRRLDAGAQQVEADALLHHGQGPPQGPLGDAAERRRPDEGREVLVERVAEVRGLDAGERYPAASGGRCRRGRRRGRGRRRRSRIRPTSTASTSTGDGRECRARRERAQDKDGGSGQEDQS